MTTVSPDRPAFAAPSAGARATAGRAARVGALLGLTLLAASGGAPLVISALVNSLQGKSAAPTQATALMLAAAIEAARQLLLPPEGSPEIVHDGPDQGLAIRINHVTSQVGKMGCGTGPAD